MQSFKLYENDAIIHDSDLFLVKHTKHNLFSRYHDHDFYEFFFMIEGNLTENRNGNKVKLQPGDCLLVRPGDQHGYPEWRKEKFSFYNLAFRKSYWRELVQNYPQLSWPRLVNSNNPIAFSLGKQDFEYCLYSLDWILKMNDREHLHLAGLNFLGRMALQFWLNDSFGFHDDAPYWMISILHLVNDVRFIKEGIPFLRKEIPVSYEHFSRQFRKQTNQTPALFLKKKRTNLASALLIGSDLSIGEVAEECGYENNSHFHHQFKEEYGLSPLRYRKKMNRIITDASIL